MIPSAIEHYSHVKFVLFSEFLKSWDVGTRTYVRHVKILVVTVTMAERINILPLIELSCLPMIQTGSSDAGKGSWHSSALDVDTTDDRKEDIVSCWQITKSAKLSGLIIARGDLFEVIN